jgi:Ca2+-binding RTX toxin-like protein
VPAYHPRDAGFYGAGIEVRGRDALDDLLFGTPFADGFYGEQNAADLATHDTVSYADSNAGVRVAIALRRTLFGALVVTGEGRDGHAQGDRFTGVENVIGSPFNDFLTMTGDFANVLEGGAGDDVLSAGEGDDTYIFAAGWGHDRIDETAGAPLAAGDRIVFTPGIRREDVGFSRPEGTDDLLITAADGNSVTVIGHFGGEAVEWFVFAGPEGEVQLTAGEVAGLILARDGLATIPPALRMLR